MTATKTLLTSSLVLYFVIAFEVLIMISPFAGFFYSVFNPLLLNLAAHPATRWLSAFYLPHMVLPADPFLRFVRIMGSVLFLAGFAVFLVCAIRIYSAKFGKKGAVIGGIYSVVRHPQYLALATAGLGLSILWPRFLTIVLWLVMTGVYYLLAKDEERRMLNSDPEKYSRYMKKTGMFLPAAVEKRLSPESRAGRSALALAFAAAVIGSAFLLRAYTISHLTLWSPGPSFASVAILPEDGFKMEHRMPGILGLKEVRERIEGKKNYLVYFIPRDYVMQGMIADTGGDWKLFEQHRTIGMIADWVFNPFGHLRGGHHAMHAQMQQRNHPAREEGVVRRLVFLSIGDVDVRKPSDLFAVNALRVPQFMADLDVHSLRLLGIRDLPHGSGWGTVPTPVF